MSETFCQICRHPSPGHEAGCPVLTGEAVRGFAGIGPQDMQPLNQIQQAQGTLGGLGGTIYPACPQTSQERPLRTATGTLDQDLEARLTKELRMQVAVNSRLSRELIELQLKAIRKDQLLVLAAHYLRTRFSDLSATIPDIDGKQIDGAMLAAQCKKEALG
jgi:signal transduction histidine kinase